MKFRQIQTQAYGFEADIQRVKIITLKREIMRNLYMRSVAFLLAAISAPAALASTSNYMQCAAVSSRFEGNCKLLSEELAPRQNEHSVFTIDYTYNCSPGNPQFLSIALVGDETMGTHITAFGTSSRATLEGFGPVTIVDQNPSKTFGARFMPGCSLSITQVSVEISGREIERLAMLAASKAEVLTLALQNYRLHKTALEFQNGGRADLIKIRDFLNTLPKTDTVDSQLASLSGTIKTLVDLTAANPALKASLDPQIDIMRATYAMLEELPPGTEIQKQLSSIEIILNRTFITDQSKVDESRAYLDSQVAESNVILTKLAGVIARADQKVKDAVEKLKSILAAVN